ncbi:MAG: Gfo/Idh/MocA family oxidoreductase [Planctomycetes bacterium]|nr:Gfo/Idh/MocA family oxidoreductase [Planctomycetota bacterium]
MSQGNTVGFGLLGAGLIAPFHAKSIQAAEGCELIAVADMNAERAAKCADTFGCEAVSSLEDLLGDDRIDVVCILTPNHLHHDAAVAAARAGKHVLTEKPPAMSLAETDAMIAACREAGVHLGVVLQCRVRKPIQAMRRAIAEGRFGRLIHADVYMKWFRAADYYRMDPWRSSRRSGAGVTIQHAFHYIDLVQYLMGPVTEVSARMTNMAHGDVDLEDTLDASLTYANGARGVVVASTAMWPGADVRIEINGSDGAAVMAGERMERWQFRQERDGDEAIRALGRGAVATAASGPADFDFADHQVVIEAMAEAVRGRGEPFIAAPSARKTLEIALAMYQSAARDVPVRLPVEDDPTIWK